METFDPAGLNRVRDNRTLSSKKSYMCKGDVYNKMELSLKDIHSILLTNVILFYMNMVPKYYASPGHHQMLKYY